MKEEVLTLTCEQIEDRYGIELEKIAPFPYCCTAFTSGSDRWESLTVVLLDDVASEVRERVRDYLLSLPNLSCVGGNPTEATFNPIRDCRLKTALKHLSDRQKDQVLEFIGSLKPSITCPFCHKISHNLNDIEQEYCGFCRRFHQDVEF